MMTYLVFNKYYLLLFDPVFRIAVPTKQIFMFNVVFFLKTGTTHSTIFFPFFEHFGGTNTRRQGVVKFISQHLQYLYLIQPLLLKIIPLQQIVILAFPENRQNACQPQESTQANKADLHALHFHNNSCLYFYFSVVNGIFPCQ